MKRTNSRERGNSILEFAIVASLFLVPMLAGSYELGMCLVKMLQVGQVARDANILVVRGIDMSQSDNQSLIVKTAQGLGMNLSGTNNPDPNGLGVVILTTVHKVSGNDCLAEGQKADSSCPNYEQYVITRRITFGNSAKLTSVTGNPSDTLASNGTLTQAQWVMDTGDRASGFPGLVTLVDGTDAYVAEDAFDISSIQVFASPRLSIIYSRHIS
jgi:Flp pilus assembly protein TadG